MEEKKLVEMLREVLDTTREKILNTKHAEALKIETDISFCDTELNETPEYVPGKSNAIYAYLTVYMAGFDGEEDPAYGYTMMIDLEEKKLSPTELFEKEKEEFLTDTDRFIALLEETDDPAALIKAESDDAEREVNELMEKFERDMRKLKIASRIAIGALIGVLVLIVILKAIL
ncbi:MAG: hypothetical protein IJY18_06635 [Clostridia bacterium]|nr:hypothetical protein [Clostridia bacterium]